jgi:hypothetical protein
LRLPPIRIMEDILRCYLIPIAILNWPSVTQTAGAAAHADACFV